MTSKELLLGVGSAALLGCDDELVLREFHPSAHAGFQLAVVVDDGIVGSADPRMGFMHRGSEKLYESRDYRQLMMLANRHDWLSAFANELVIALALEEALGITPPERATWTRTLMAEANRVMAALAFLGPIMAASSVAFRVREQFTIAQEIVTGARVHPMYTRVGGVAIPITSQGLDAFDVAVKTLNEALPAIGDEVLAYAQPLAGLAPLTREQAIAFGTSGVVARASALDLDLRRDEPNLAYGELAELLEVPIASAGDAETRYRLLVEQLPISARLIGASIDRLRSLGEGPHDVLLPKTVRAPEGVTYSRLEGPLGIVGCLLASAGDKLPWRLKIRSASFAHAQSMTKALVGVPFEHLADAVMSFFFVVGEIDR